MRPIRVHLDTSDYSAMHDAPPGSQIAVVCDTLKEMARSGQIEIGLSYHVIFELLQRADPEHCENRLSRARLLTELCGRHAFSYPTDLGNGLRFSKEGLWQPRIILEDHEIEIILDHLIQAVRSDLETTPHIRRVVTKRKYLSRWAEECPQYFKAIAGRNWPVMFGKSLIEDGSLGRYVTGEMSRDEANSKLWFFINDPASIYELWFEQCQWGSPIIERRDNMSDKLVTMLEELRRIVAETGDLRKRITSELNATGSEALSSDERSQLTRLRKDLKTFREEISSPQGLLEDVPIWKKLFGSDSAFLAAEILYAFVRDKRPIKHSDGIDFVHAMYLPHADLWRGDRAFANLLVKHGVSYSERVVPTLLELPARIEAERVGRISEA